MFSPTVTSVLSFSCLDFGTTTSFYYSARGIRTRKNSSSIITRVYSKSRHRSFPWTIRDPSLVVGDLPEPWVQRFPLSSVGVECCDGTRTKNNGLLKVFL